MFILYYEQLPFFHENYSDLYKLIMVGKFEFPSDCRNTRFRDLISGMICVDLDKRLSLQEVIAHEYF